jgi:hypothetical protein
MRETEREQKSNQNGLMQQDSKTFAGDGYQFGRSESMGP